PFSSPARSPFTCRRSIASLARAINSEARTLTRSASGAAWSWRNSIVSRSSRTAVLQVGEKLFNHGPSPAQIAAIHSQANRCRQPVAFSRPVADGAFRHRQPQGDFRGGHELGHGHGRGHRISSSRWAIAKKSLGGGSGGAFRRKSLRTI